MKKEREVSEARKQKTDRSRAHGTKCEEPEFEREQEPCSVDIHSANTFKLKGKVSGLSSRFRGRERRTKEKSRGKGGLTFTLAERVLKVRRRPEARKKPCTKEQFASGMSSE